MKKIFVAMFWYFICIAASAQKKEKQFSFALMNVQSAMPFEKFVSMFAEVIHPGFEAGIEYKWKEKGKHDWFQEFKAGCFFHRFVQTAIPVCTNFGYRYKFLKQFSGQVKFGIGYLHSIPATDQLKLSGDGRYKNAKGIGRMQGMVTLGFQLNYTINSQDKNPLAVFANYGQMLQMPFIKSYVPLLPYNSFSIGITKSLRSKKPL